MREVPYYTSDDESEWTGHVWRQRSHVGGPWGFAWEVLAPYGEEPVATGWRSTQAGAEQGMLQSLETHRPKASP